MGFMVGFGILPCFLHCTMLFSVDCTISLGILRYQTMVRGNRAGRRMANADTCAVYMICSTCIYPSLSYKINHCTPVPTEDVSKSHRDPQIAKDGLSANESELGACRHRRKESGHLLNSDLSSMNYDRKCPLDLVRVYRSFG